MGGTLSPGLITPSDLESAIRHVKLYLLTQRPGFRLVHEDLSVYYTDHLTSYFCTADSLFMHLKVPIAETNTLYEIYQASVFPVPIQTANPSSVGYTAVTNVSPYFAVDVSRNSYIELTQSDYASCQGDALVTCPFALPHRLRPAYSCTAVLFFHQDRLFTDKCHTSVYPHDPIPTHITESAPSTFYITSPESSVYKTVCPGHSLQAFPACAFCSVTIPCGCTLHVDKLSLTPPIIDCDPNIESLSVLHTINYAVVLHFGFPAHSYHSFSLSNVSVKLDIPDMSAYVKRFTDLSKQEKSSALDLKKLSAAIQAKSTKYHNPEPR